jgi:Tol biopolymer transport system component
MKSITFFISLTVMSLIHLAFCPEGKAQNSALQAGSDSTFIEKIAFYSERNAPAEIYTMDVDGSGLKRLTNNNAEDQCPAFSPDGSRIAFCSNRDGNYEIYLMNNDGSNLKRLTSTSQKESQPEWSPDGENIVFNRWSPNSWEDGDIFIIDADGSNERQLTTHPANDSRPQWFSNGSKIIFNSKRDGNYEIYTMNADGTNQQRLTNTASNEMFPELSPDTKKIAYALMDFQTFKAEIHVMNADGTGDTLIARGGNITENARWSPDGSKILFQTDRTGNFEIFIMNADGSNPQNLTKSAAYDYWPCWGRIKVPTTVRDNFGEMPKDFRLYQNHPNPFNPETKIAFHLPAKEFVTLKILNVLGKEIATPLQNSYEAGLHEIFWNGAKHSSGIYFYQLSTNRFHATKKMILAK